MSLERALLSEWALKEQSEELKFDNDHKTAKFEGFSVPHVITTREAGNMSYSWGEKEKVRLNKKSIYDQIGVEEKEVVHLLPEHSDRIKQVSEQDTEQPIKCDALITDTKGLALEVAPADCYSLIIASKESAGTLALVHVSRKNINTGIIQEVISTIEERVENLSSVRVALAPGIKSCCYRFNLLQALSVSKLNSHDLLTSSLASGFPSWTIVVDLQREIISRLVKPGMLLDITFSLECTFCSTFWQEEKEFPLFFSHERAEETNEKEGRNLVLARLPNSDT